MSENFEGVGERISTRLEELNLKQVDVCKATGMSKNAVSNYVSGKRIPDTHASYKLSKFLSVTMEWLLTGEEPKSYIETTEVSEALSQNISPDDIELLSKFYQLSERDKGRVEGIIEEILLNKGKQAKREESLHSANGNEHAATRAGA